MAVWKRNLYILWAGSFLSSVGMNMIIPFLPLYVQELGVHDIKQAALWAAFVFAANHIMIALVSPLWGRLSDIHGQKTMMICSGLGMGILVIAMGLIHTPLQLIVLRMVFGCVAGFAASASALTAVETPKEHAGSALGTLQTGIVSGQLLGPIFGGLLAETYGIRNAFYLTGFLLLLATVLVITGVMESRKYPREGRSLPGPFGRKAGSFSRGISLSSAFGKNTLIDVMKHSPMVWTLFISSFLISASLLSIEPVITLYVQSLHVERHVELMGGLVFGASALGTILSAPYLGKLGDRHGHAIVLLASLFFMSVLYIPQAWITNVWLLLFVRWLTGLCMGGMIPAISALLRTLTPVGMQGSVFGYLSSANSLGNVSGALLGGTIGNAFGISHIFYIVSGIFFIHFAMLLLRLRKLHASADRKLEEPGFDA
ncbi:MFS transporter [Paenibacillus solisilvae]|uniref:MFS transporter n=1 Tax=Paenibacillus solisilvae TaxID=2486751 RepID=A0ABW0VRJ9_9BACL